MCNKLTIAWGAAITLSLAGAAAADDPILTPAYPSSQAASGVGGPANQGGMAAPGGPGTSAMPGAAGPQAPTSPDGSLGAGMGMGTGAGSGVFDGLAGQGTGGGGFSSGLGGFAGASGAPPGIIGDFQPISNSRLVHSAATSGRFPNLPTPVPPPHVNNNPGIVSPGGTTSVLLKLTGLKISDNQSPIPQDRVFFSFNYFDNLNATVNRREMSPVSNLQVYHELFGIEKTFFDGRASLGFRVPLNTISLNTTANLAGLGGSHTSTGDLSIFLKYILYQNQGNLFTAGLQVTPPTGPGAFGGNKYYSYFRDTQIQPFVGYLFTRDRFYFQGFSSINVPTTSRDVTLLFNDLSMGYYVYRPSDLTKIVTAIVPTAEVHVTTPLNHLGSSSADLASTPNIVNMTFGTNLELRRRALISAAYVTPVTGPKPFNAEFVLLLNIRFGRSAQGLSPVAPPIIQ